jgi:hypothetical protein
MADLGWPEDDNRAVLEAKARHRLGNNNVMYAYTGS